MSVNHQIDLNTLHRGDELRSAGVIALDVRISKRSRRIYLKVGRNRHIELVLPQHHSLNSGISFVEQNHHWLLRTLSRIVDIQPTPDEPPQVIHLRALSREFDVVYKESSAKTTRIKEQGDRVIVHVGQDNLWRPALQRWLHKTAKEQLIPLLNQVSKNTGLSYNRVTIRGQNKRWGSCSAGGNLSINYKLLFLEPEYVEYLFVHELCHTRQMNHSKKYWSLVEQYIPDYHIYDKGLRRMMDRLPAWV